MATIDDIRKQLAEMAQPFAELKKAAEELSYNAGRIAQRSGEIGGIIAHAADPSDYADKLLEFVQRFDECLLAAQAAIRAAMATSTMDAAAVRSQEAA